MEQTNHQPQSAPGENPSFTIDYVLSRIDQILQDSRHIHAAIEAITALSPAALPRSSQLPDPRPEAIARTVIAREETNRRLLDMLGRMYQDLHPTPEKPSEAALLLEKLAGIIQSQGPDDDEVTLAFDAPPSLEPESD